VTTSPGAKCPALLFTASLADRGRRLHFLDQRRRQFMHIVLAGDPNIGFTAVGPYADSATVDDDGNCTPIQYDEAEDWWVVPLQEPSDPNGRFVIFNGSIEALAFIGPFADEETARSYGRPLVPNIVMKLQPPGLGLLSPLDTEEPA
jgi:hypothetical protein